MLPGLGDKYADVATAISEQGNKHVIGVVVDVFGGIWKTKNKSSSITFTIKDRDLNNGHTWDGLRIKYFSGNESQLPPVELGDVVLLKNLYIRSLNGKPMGVAAEQKTIPWAIWRDDPDPNSRGAPITGPSPWEPYPSESKYARGLLAKSTGAEGAHGAKGFRDEGAERIAAPRSHTVVHASMEKPRIAKSFSLIRDVEERMYTSLVVEILGIIPNGHERALVYVTDYTANEGLPSYEYDEEAGREGDEFNYQGRPKPAKGPSKMTIQVTLWEPHSSFAQNNLKKNDIVLLSNVQIKRSRVVGGCLEASISGNRNDPRAVNVEKVDATSDEHAQELVKRREEYLEKHPEKRKLEDTDDPAKNAKKRNRPVPKAKETKREEGQGVLPTSFRSQLNDKIQASHRHRPNRTIEAILDKDSHNNASPDAIEYRLPFQNLSYRTNVKVVDFFPPNLADFAVPEKAENTLDTSPSQTHGDRITNWEWRFCLLVEGAEPVPRGTQREQMKLYVAGPDAVHFLQLDAADLRKSPQRLSELKERLFYVWGNLEERKSGISPDRLSQRPFECCIQEYGVPCSHALPDDRELGCSQGDCFGWERRFGIFGTTIQWEK
ncbi:telomere-binding alpha subunit central domain protein [Aspergillus campestris IBT 28561]|uniref:Protection of telomeres protein 1 n=1 Tax=Aspergillus campestris (strain IBT 28561) TaxID=1392248 RepID=A0A2I1D6L4_ASPC2|nr:telomere-binding alpha subunit central domain protein [Aspergillus campestris IBT 28561]PKY05522.1 telomere-binding alpha subunit central domain protein [Aspergillus campestris IBT 28561]